jgi:NitT/TauT family transport system substrate-binding protein
MHNEGRSSLILNPAQQLMGNMRYKFIEFRLPDGGFFSIRRLKYPAALLFFICLSTSVPWAAAANDLAQMSFIPQWSPQAQFAGYYVAMAKGYYERCGLDLDIFRGGPDAPAGEALREGKADLATLFLTGGLQLRSQGVPVVNVGQIVKRSALMLVAKKVGGIISIEDLDGKRVSVWEDFALQPMAFLRRNRLYVTLIPQGYTLNLFLMGGVDAASAMWYNEYHTILNSGLDPDELTTFFLADHGFNFPEDGIYCLERTLRENPALVRCFVQASLEGWRYAFEHREEALDIVMEHVQSAKLPTNRIHQKWMLDRMQEIIFPAGATSQPGFLSEDEYEFVAAELFEAEIITDISPYRMFYDPRPSAR